LGDQGHAYGSSAGIVRALSDDMGRGLGVHTTVWTVGHVVWPEMGGVGANDGVACGEANER
jgi:hypothetical protein